MNPKFAEWYEIAQINAEHESLNRRWQTVEKLAGSLKPNGVFDLVKAYDGQLATDGGPIALVEALREFDSAFVSAGRDVELGIIAAAALNELLLSKRAGISDLVALSLVAHSFQGLRNASPIPELVANAEAYLTCRSAELRKPAIDACADSVIPKENIDGLTQALKDNQLAQAAEQLNVMATAQNRIVSEHNSEIKAIARQMRLFREESDILWWVIGSHSRIMACSFDKLEIGCASLMAGRELADLTQVVPGPFAIGAFAKRVLVTAFGDKAAKDISLSAAINEVPRDVRRPWGETANGAAGLDVCPLYSAIGHSLSVNKPTEWAAMFRKSQSLDAKMKCAPVVLARQMYIESILLRTEA